MASSTAPAVKAALVALLADALGGVAVAYGPPPPGVLAGREFVWVGAITHTQAAAALGRRRRSDEYEIEVVCDVRGADRVDHQELTERAYELAAAVEDTVRDWEPQTVVEGAILVEVVAMVLAEGFVGESANRASRATLTLRTTTRI